MKWTGEFIQMRYAAQAIQAARRTQESRSAIRPLPATWPDVLTGYYERGMLTYSEWLRLALRLSFDSVAEQVLEERHEVWRRLGNGLVGG